MYSVQSEKIMLVHQYEIIFSAVKFSFSHIGIFSIAPFSSFHYFFIALFVVIAPPTMYCDIDICRCSYVLEEKVILFTVALIKMVGRAIVWGEINVQNLKNTKMKQRDSEQSRYHNIKKINTLIFEQKIFAFWVH